MGTPAPDESDRPGPTPSRGRTDRDRAAARARIEHQQTWVDVQLRKAREDGAFDDLPGYGRPLTGLGEEQDPDWWVKQLIERERIAVVPAALQLRRDDALLDGELDLLPGEPQVRARVREFNERVRQVLYSTTGWPPVTTGVREEDLEVARWRERRTARQEQRREERSAAREESPRPPRSRRRRLRSPFRGRRDRAE